MAANQEIPIGDDELDSLMAELERETAGLVAAPVVTAAAPVAAPADDIDDLDLDALEPTAAPAVVTSEMSNDDMNSLAQELGGDDLPFEPEASAGAVVQSDIDAEMAALEAELSETPNVVTKAVKALTASDPAPETDDMMTLEVQLTAPVNEKLKAGVAKLLKEDDDLKNLEVSGEIEITTNDAEMLADRLDNPEPANEALTKAMERVKPAPAPADEDDAPAHPNPKKTTLEFHIDVNEFRRDTRVSETNLDDCLMQQAGLVAEYVAKHAYSEAQAARVKLQVDIAEAKLYDEHRKAAAARATITGDKVTEKMVENAVRTDPRYAGIHKRLIEAESIAAVNKGLVESLKQRRDMLIQLGADRREDGKGAARIMAAQANDSNVADRARAAADAARRPKSEG
jgi:uncharacterized protein (DUF1778 family)